MFIYCDDRNNKLLSLINRTLISCVAMRRLEIPPHRKILQYARIFLEKIQKITS